MSTDAEAPEQDVAAPVPEPEESGPARIVAILALAMAILGFALVAVLRDAAQHLNADGIQQSTMSIQNVDLFYWGQDRLAALTSWLASPIADPDLNLWACLMINATVFYGFLATLARLGVRTLTGSRSWVVTLIAFLVLAASFRLMFASRTIYILALEGQPYGWSHLLVLWAFMLWRTRRPVQAVLATGCVLITVGINSAAILLLATLALAAVVVERRTWLRSLLWWGLLGVVCVAAQGVWTVLAARYGGVSGPVPEPPLPYFEFTGEVFQASWRPVLENLLATLRLPTWIAVSTLAGVAALSVPVAWRSRLRTLFVATALFAGGYAWLFMSNHWVLINGHHFRYFAPVLFAFMVLVAAPLSLWLIGLVTRPVPDRDGLVRALRGPGPVALVAAAIVAATLAVSTGQLRNPADADVLQAMQPTADFATDRDIRFISGYYWMMWPVLHASLDGGRDDLFIAGTKSGGALAGYHEAFAEARQRGDGSVEALCVGASVEECTMFLTYWTAPGWEDSGRTCPIPPDDSPAFQRDLLGNPPERICRILVNASDADLTRQD